MKKVFKFVIALAAAVPLFSACNDNKSDYPEWGSYVTVQVPSVGSYYFLDDDGGTAYPGDVSRIPTYDSSDKGGKRAYIYFSFLKTEVPDYDYNLAIYKIIDILSKNVEVADTEEQVTEAGDDKINIAVANISGKWLDIEYALLTTSNATHKLTMLDNKTVEAPADMPADYQYLEFRQNADGVVGTTMAAGNVSYLLSDEYNPAVTGKKGFYIRVNTTNSEVKYVTVEYKAPVENKAKSPRFIEPVVLSK